MPAPGVTRHGLGQRDYRGKRQTERTLPLTHRCRAIQASCSAMALRTAPLSDIRLPVIADLRKSRGIDAVALHPLRQSEQIGVADRIVVTHHPWPSQHFALDQLVAGAHGVRYLALHRRYRGRIVGPAMSANAVGMGHVQGRAQIAVEGLHLGKAKGIIQRRELRRWKALGDESEDRGVSVSIPRSVTKAGTRPLGLMARYSGERC